MAKQYISPIRLFEHCSIEIDGEINIARIKKQLTAEFGFAKTGFIEVDGFSYNKNDILEELENADFLQRLTYHKRLWEDKNLLQVLEKNTVDLSTINTSFNKFQNDKEFDTFFSPYFAEPFNYITRTFLNEKNFHNLGFWLSYEDFLQLNDREIGFKSIRIFLDENLRYFNNISIGNYTTFRPKIVHWLWPDWSTFLNNLPDEFYSDKCDIVSDLINLTVTLQKTDTKDCKSISYELVKVADLPANLQEIINDNHHVFAGDPVAKPSSDWGNSWWLIWVVIFFVRLISNGSCNKSNDYKFDVNKYRSDNKFIDSLLKKNESKFIDSILTSYKSKDGVTLYTDTVKVYSKKKK